MGKVTLISDFVYGSVEISDFEKSILSTRIFNRLHNVLQTSTAYLTYPTLRTTRFSHSIGAMHLASGIFVSAFQNADEEEQEKFLEDAQKEIAKLLKHKFDTDFIDFSFPWQELRCALLQENLPNSPLFQRQQAYLYTYLVLFQALRVSALLHDVGHPPFSHVVERFYQRLRAKHESVPNDIDNHMVQKEIQTIFESFDDKIPMHEQLGTFLTQALFNEIVPPFATSSSPSADQLFNHLVADFSQKITKSEPQKGSVFASLHTIVAGDLDADRMDYVSRDYFISGLVGSPIRYDRLIASYTMKQTDQGFGFYPSVRALNTLENYFQSRFNLYKHALYHHRVAKTDALLEYCLTAIVERYLEEKTSSSDTPKQAYLSVCVENLWQVLAYDPSEEKLAFFIDRLSQWDDAWMLSLLRKEYFTLLEKSQQAQLSNQEELLLKRLAELLSNHKNYYSLYKRLDSMIEFEEAICDGMQSTTEPITAPPQPLRNPEMVQKIITLLETPSVQKEIEASTGIRESMIVEKKMKAGLSDDNPFYLFKDGALMELDRISSLRNELKESLKLMPSYYIFILIDAQTAEQASMHQLRKTVGWIIGKHLT